MAAVNRNMFDASIMTDRPNGSSLMVLPLNIIAMIISHMDDTGDLARLCSTCRVLNYMALPQLYRNLTLTSYDKIRYRGVEPEGMGSASPFSLGLSAVITRPYASLVRSLTLRGDWREHDLEEHARVGRVPDSSMMLNIAVRAAVDRMTDLQTFNWELNTKMLETVYLGLAQLPKLTSLTIRFPSSRHPRPNIVIPPMPHLRYLKVMDMDPLCYPDDISTLLWKSKKLRELTMHWSPRMRNAQEPSVMLNHYFRKCNSAKYLLPISKLSLLNLYAFHSEEFNLVFNPKTMKEVTILNDTASEGGNFMNDFVDNSWPTYPPHSELSLKVLRQNSLSKKHSEFLGRFTGLEKLYFVNTHDSVNSVAPLRPSTGVSSATLTPPMDQSYSTGTAIDSPSPSPLGSSPSLRDAYLTSIISNHCATLRHLLLPSWWSLSTATIARLVHASPQLEQLAFAADLSSLDTLALLLPFLRNLTAIRLLVPTGRASQQTESGLAAKQNISALTVGSSKGQFISAARSVADIVELDDEIITEKMSMSLADQQIYGKLRVVGLGRKAWELGKFYLVPAPPEQRNQDESEFFTTPRARDVEEVDSQSQTPVNGTGNRDPSVAAPNNNSPNARSSQWGTHAVLGKRSREDDPSPEMPSKHYHTMPPDEENDPCLIQIVNSDGRHWRREMRRVGWEVLKNWEVWGLDTQEP